MYFNAFAAAALAGHRWGSLQRSPRPVLLQVTTQKGHYCETLRYCETVTT